MPRKVPAPPVNPILIPDLPRADEQALSSFIEIPGNIYQNSSLGRWQNQDEGTSCDCVYTPGRSESYLACGDGSDCINRLTLVECIEGDCPSRSHCQNQRLQRKYYAPIGVVLTEKKGYGLRAEEDIASDSLIYEYIGEVVQEREFLRRMQKYAQESIQHFYFMMLQKDEFIDATKKGGIGRFANHSCNPNCYVSKWFVGNHVRMGIFAKRRIFQYEELTFNYNVDRYGHDAQECFCGEPNCVGYIGGKTQTDIGVMDDLYLDALGITEDVEQLGLKGSRRRKSRKLDEDYVPPLKPISEEDVPTLCQAIRAASSSSKNMLPHLLNRLKVTEDTNALRGMMRLRGFSLMTTLLGENEHDLNICKSILESIERWPLLNRNKVEDSKIEEPVRKLTASEDSALAEKAKSLLALWTSLSTAYRIPRRPTRIQDEDGEPIRVIAVTERPEKRVITDDEAWQAPTFKLTKLEEPQPSPLPPESPAYLPTFTFPTLAGPSKTQLQEIIAQATQAAALAAEAAQREAEEAEKEKLVADAAKAKAKERYKKKKTVKNDPGTRLLKLVGEVVVRYMSRYRDLMHHDTFKKHAKELTHLITGKEMKSSSFKDGKVESLSDEKRKKMKKYIEEYVQKLLKKLEARGKLLKPRSNGDSRSISSSKDGSTPTLNGHDLVNCTEYDLQNFVDDLVDDEGEGPEGEEEGSSTSAPPHDHRTVSNTRSPVMYSGS
ncbi:uncharacterized protein EI90DRAFT_3056248 [Cantharellus anzutake]|uniref:uncharacterized protein n=1 Tax=Cantharellus anzutake TaxID=1750568 RepID=UPI001908890C|nr:uncharacterized protein EI90DRAFT_3056248 [Cantharellus anzutake]KAF8332013.1 hypothetical protein EI90DRAFT_3056248 [Cantharellus anzutake]